MEAIRRSAGVDLRLDEVDLELHGEGDDLTVEDIWERWLGRIAAGEYDVIIVSPPCHTHSRAVWSNSKGPGPVRDRAHPRGFPWLRGADRAKCEAANLLLDRALVAVRAGWQSPAQSAFLLEHPEDLGAVSSNRVPASIWQDERLRELVRQCHGHSGALHQCRYEGALSSKPTRLASNLPNFADLVVLGWPGFVSLDVYRGPLPRSCGHAHPPLIGMDPRTNEFRTTPSAVYPPGMCQDIAQMVFSEYRLRHPLKGG